MKFDNLLEINRNQNGDYYFIYSVPNVKNHINPKAKSRDEVIIVGIPQKRLIQYLSPSPKWNEEYESLLKMINQMTYDANFRELMINTLDKMVSILLGESYEADK